MFLQKEKHVEHNGTDEKIIQWCIENLERKYFNTIQGGFGCSCEDVEYDEMCQLDHDDGPLIAEYLNQNERQVIQVYFCPDCQEWAVDDDF